MVEPDYKVRVFWKKPDDLNYALQWHHATISSEGAWDYSTGSSAVKVRGAGWRHAHACIQAVQQSCTQHACMCMEQPSSSPPRLCTCPCWDVLQVCHVDSGVRVDHPDLVDNVLKGWNLVPPGQVRYAVD